MAPLPVIADVFRCSWTWSTATGLTGANVFHVRAPGATESDISGYLNSSGHLGMLNQVYSAANMQALTIEKLDGASAPQIFTAPTWGSGSGTGDAIPQACILASFRTALRGAAHRGRMYLPFVAEGEQSSGVLGSTNLATAQGHWDNFRTAMIANSAPLVVASYKNSTAEDVTGIHLESIIATQKRRVDRLRP